MLMLSIRLFSYSAIIHLLLPLKFAFICIRAVMPLDIQHCLNCIHSLEIKSKTRIFFLKIGPKRGRQELKEMSMEFSAVTLLNCMERLQLGQ